MLLAGPFHELPDCADTPCGVSHKIKNCHRPKKHKYALYGICSDDRDKSANRGVEHDDDEGQTNGDLIGHAKKNLKQMPSAFKNCEEV